MKKNKVWRIKGFEGQFTDDEVIDLIRKKQIRKDFYLTSRDIKQWIKLEDSIYQFYLEDENDETI